VDQGEILLRFKPPMLELALMIDAFAAPATR
jgi:hypothetical protein